MVTGVIFSLPFSTQPAGTRRACEVKFCSDHSVGFQCQDTSFPNRFHKTTQLDLKVDYDVSSYLCIHSLMNTCPMDAWLFCSKLGLCLFVILPWSSQPQDLGQPLPAWATLRRSHVFPVCLSWEAAQAPRGHVHSSLYPGSTEKVHHMDAPGDSWDGAVRGQTLSCCAWESQQGSTARLPQWFGFPSVHLTA